MWSLHNKCNVCSECCICHVEFKVCLVSKCFEKNVTTINCFLFQVWNWCWWWWKFFVFKFKTPNLTEQITSWGDYDAQCLYGVVSDKDRKSEMSDRMPQCQRECQNRYQWYQIECQIESQNMCKIECQFVGITGSLEESVFLL